MNAKVSKSKVMSKAWEIFKAGTRNFATALREAWKQIKQLATALRDGVVRFWKQDGTITTRRIAPLANFDYTPKGSSFSTSTVKVVDLDKLEATNDVAKSIISFHPYQLLDTVNAEIIYENFEVPFAHIDCDFDGDTNTITVTVRTEQRDTLALCHRPTIYDDCASVTERFKQLLQEAYAEYESDLARADRNWVNWQQEQGYGCTGIL